jgi:hypothetical protein
MITNELKEKVKELAMQGMPLNAISKELSISRPSVYKILDLSGDPKGEGASLQPLAQSGNEVGKQIRHHHRFPGRRVIRSEKLDGEIETTEVLKEQVERVKLKKELKNLTEGEARERMKEKEEKDRNRWKEKWVRFGEEVFWLESSEVPAEIRLEVKKAILRFLDGLSSSDDEEISLAIIKKMDVPREQFCRRFIYPRLKREMIWQAMESLRIPRWMVDEKAEKIRIEVRSSLENVVCGDEEIEEVCELARCLIDELADEI